MSSAFTKEQDDNNPREDLPDRPISSHRNLVTPEGLQQIEAHLTRLHQELESATTKDDAHALAVAQRDLRYWTARRASAEVISAITDHSQIRFGHHVVVELQGGEKRSFKLVGKMKATPLRDLSLMSRPLLKPCWVKALATKLRSFIIAPKSLR